MYLCANDNACVCAHARAQRTRALVCACTHTCRDQRLMSDVYLNLSPPYFLGFSEPEAQWLARLANKLQGSSCCCLPSPGTAGTLCWTWICIWMPDTELRSSCLLDRHFTNWEVCSALLFVHIILIVLNTFSWDLIYRYSTALYGNSSN